MKACQLYFVSIALIFIINYTNNSSSYCQSVSDTSDLIKYSPDFKFTDGIFLNFDQVKKNDPIEKSRILTNLDHQNPDFFDLLLSNKTLNYFDELGIKQSLSTRNLWGYSRNGNLYIKINNAYHRITVVGSACHFVASITTYNPNYYDPYYYNYNYYRYGLRSSSYPNTEMRQFLLDFKTGKVLEYTGESVEIILMNDPELFDEFASLRKKKQKQLKFLYIRKYNERNPLYFPDKYKSIQK